MSPFNTIPLVDQTLLGLIIVCMGSILIFRKELVQLKDNIFRFRIFGYSLWYIGHVLIRDKITTLGIILLALGGIIILQRMVGMVL